MLIYEEYRSAKDKRKAQRKGAKRGVATGLAKGYLFVFDEDGIQHTGVTAEYEALGEILETDDGQPDSIGSVTPTLNFLSTRCRRIGFNALPEAWKRAFATKLNTMLDHSPELKEQRKRYRKVLRWSEMPVQATYTCVFDDSVVYESPCLYNKATKTVTDIEIADESDNNDLNALTDEYVTLQDGTKLREADGVTFNY